MVHGGGGPQRLLVTLAAVSLTLIAAPGAEPAPPGNFQTSLIVGDGLNGPSGFEIAPDGRIFILERSGKIKVVKNGQLLPDAVRGPAVGGHR